MNPNQHSKENRLLLLESFIANEGLTQRFLDFENSMNVPYPRESVDMGLNYHTVSMIDKSLLTMYSETKELIDWFGLSVVVGGLSDLVTEYMFSYKSNKQKDLVEEAIQLDQIRDTTQMILRLIKYMTELDFHIGNVEKFKDTVSGHLFSRYPDVPHSPC